MAPRITSDEITLLSGYIFDISGIHISRDKSYLLENRLGPLLGLAGCRNFNELYRKAKARPGGDLEKSLIDAISTNETFFFRDNIPFELLKNKIIPELIDQRCRQHPNMPTQLRIWSAACSTGQEVYSIAITILEMLPDLSGFDISILGTDISNKALAQASYGQYNQFEIGRGLPEHLLRKYFHKSDSYWRINDEVRMLATFKHLNLIHDFGNIGRFDVIFCRNVAIYFNHTNKINLFRKLAHNLMPEGALIVGGSETLREFAPDFEAKQYLKGIFYQLKGSSKEQAAQAVTRRSRNEKPEIPATPGTKEESSTSRPRTRKNPLKTCIKPVPSEKKAALPQKAKPPPSVPDQAKIEKPVAGNRGKSLFESIKDGRSSSGTTSFLAAGQQNSGGSFVAGKGKGKKKRSLLDKINDNKRSNANE